jgi:hypothetical protein
LWEYRRPVFAIKAPDAAVECESSYLHYRALDTSVSSFVAQAFPSREGYNGFDYRSREVPVYRSREATYLACLCFG